MVRTFPGVIFLKILYYVVLINEKETVQAEFLFTRCSHVVSVALVDYFIARLAHMAISYFNKGDIGVLVERGLTSVLAISSLIQFLLVLDVVIVGLRIFDHESTSIGFENI